MTINEIYNCIDKKIEPHTRIGVEKDVVFAETFRTINEAINEYRKNSNGVFDDKIEETILKSNLNDNTIKKIIEASDTKYKKDKDKYMIVSFWKNIGKIFFENFVVLFISFITTFFISFILFKQPIIEFLREYFSVK